VGTVAPRQPFAKVGPTQTALAPGVCATVGRVNAPAPGTELVGGYRLGEPAAQGAMGSIYEATDPDGRRIAAKRLLDERHAARFEIEGRLLSRLHHPRVVEVLGTVDDPTGRYLMMEWVEGEDLAHVLRREGNPGLPEERVVPLALEAAEALRYVHEQQTIHRDVKPQNLMLSPERGVVLVDFGIARDLAAESATQGIGTPGYMAPEAFTGGPLSPRTDVYGLAMTTWTLLTSVPARYASVRPPTDTSPSLLATLDAALAVDPERRLSSMEAFADGLGGRLPTERGRDIGVSAGVGEETARMLSAVVKTAAGVFDAAATSLALCSADGSLSYQAAWGAGADEVVGMRLEAGQGIAGRVVATGVGEVVQDCRNDPDFAAATARGTGYVPYTMIVVPLVPDDAAVGVLTVLDKRDGSSYDVGDLARAAMFADLALAALDAEPGARAALTTAVARGF
jgi:Protein kinase domain/GAF domain